MADDQLRRNLRILLHGLIDAIIDGREPMPPELAAYCRRAWGTDPGIWDQLHIEANPHPHSAQVLRGKAPVASTDTETAAPADRGPAISLAKRRGKTDAFLDAIGATSIRGAAKKLGVSEGTLRSWRAGRNRIPASMAERARALWGVPVSYWPRRSE